MSYRGHIAELPIGQGGLNGTRNMALVRPDELILASNLTYESGSLRKEGGAEKYNSSAISGSPRVIGGCDWWPTDGVQRMVVLLSDGNLKKDSGAGTFGVTLASGLTVSDVLGVFVEGGSEAAGANRKLFCFTGKNAVQVLAADGATTAAIATPSADWSGSSQPLFGFVHEGRMWAGGNLNRPHQIYYSMPTNHENMTGAGSGSLSIFPGEGERLIGGISYKGVAILWKHPRGIYLVDTTDPVVTNWRVERITQGVGAVSPLAIVQVDDDVLFLDATMNFQLLSGVQEFGDMASRNVSQPRHMGQHVRDHYNLGRQTAVCAMYYPAKREAHYAMSGSGATANNRRLVVDFNMPEIRFRESDRDTCESMWLREDSEGIQRPMHGDNAGFVWHMDQETRSKDGVGYTGEFQSAHLDLGYLDPKLATLNKIGDFLECVVEPTGDWDLSVDIIWDGVVKQTLSFNMGTSGTALGSFTLGTDILGGEALVNRRKRIVGSGRRFSLKGRNSGAGQDFSVARFYLEFRAGEESESRSG